MSKRICKGSPEHEDVAHHVITSFMEHKRAEELIAKNEAMKFYEWYDTFIVLLKYFAVPYIVQTKRKNA